MKKVVLSFNNVFVNQASSLVGKKEFEGPLSKRFDAYEKDEYFSKCISSFTFSKL